MEYWYSRHSKCMVVSMLQNEWLFTSILRRNTPLRPAVQMEAQTEAPAEVMSSPTTLVKKLHCAGRRKVCINTGCCAMGTILQKK